MSTNPSWMYGSVRDPAEVYHALNAGDKEVLQLLQLMLTELKKSNDEGLKLVMGQLNGIADKQRDMDAVLKLLSVLFGVGLGEVYLYSQQVKTNAVELSANVASNSGEIVGALVSALTYELFGWGERFKFKYDWLEAKEDADAQKKSEDGRKKKNEDAAAPKKK